MKRVGLRLFPWLILGLSWLSLTGSALATDIYFKSINFKEQKAPDGTMGVGALVTSSYTIANTGGTLFTTIVVQAFLCTQKLASTCKAQSFSVTRHSIVSGQISRNGTFFKHGIGARIGFPVDTTPGKRFVRLVLDAYGKVKETNENNNEAWFEFTVDGKPDLRISLLAPNPNRFYAGQDVTLTYDVHNSGRVSASNAKIAFYISTDGTFSANDVKLGEVTASYNVMATYPTGAVRKTFKVTIPTTWMGVGRNYLLAVADYDKKIPESNENNNFRNVAVTVNDSRPNLLPKARTIYLSIPNGGAGDNMIIPTEIQNSGRRDSGSFKVQFYFHSVSPANLVGTVTISNVKAQSVYQKNYIYPVPNTIRNGINSVIVVVDSERKVSETNESDNQTNYALSTNAQGELKIKSLTLTPSSLFPGAKLTATVVVENIGKVWYQSTQVLLYLSTNTTRDGRDKVLVNTDLGAIHAKSTLSKSFSITAPSGSGTHYIIAYVTPYFLESNKSDNQQAKPFTLLKKQADLSPSGIIGLSTVKVGVSTNVTVSLINKGQAAATHVMRIYYSKDVTLQSSDPQVGATTITNHAAGAVLKRTLPIKLPASATAGVGYLLTVVDADKKVVESNENNNLVFNKITVLADFDKDGVFSDLDCNDKNASIKPGAKELCDGIDNNCDKKIDEGCSCKKGDKQACGTDKGECRKGTQTCDANGKWSVCSGGVEAVKELCDGKDNDCDGSVDEDFAQLGKACSSGLGECKRSGKYRCRKDMKGLECSAPRVAAAVETCDGKDNDCDGQTDEGIAPRSCYTGPSGTAGKGVCKAGKQACISGKWDTCAGEMKPSKEVCDKKDNNCDGQVDNDPSCKPSEPSPEPTSDAGPVDSTPDIPPANCGGSNCQTGEYCRNNQCVKLCDCVKCPSGEICIDGLCQQDRCQGVTCKNSVCVDGQCVQQDPCNTINCPNGYSCKAGQCSKDKCASEPSKETNPEPTTEPSVEPSKEQASEPSSGDAGVEPVSDTQPTDQAMGKDDTKDAGAADKANSKDDNTSDSATKDSGSTKDNGSGGGCSCSTTSSTPMPWALFLMLVSFVGLLRRRKK